MVQPFRTAADTALAASAAYAAFGAAVAYPATAPAATALAFVVGYGALLFLLPFSVYALVFLLAPRRLCKTRKSMLVCAASTPVALLAAVLAVLVVATRSGGGGGDVVALATAAVWAVDLAAVAALCWCLTNGGYTPIAFRRYNQFAHFLSALRRTPKFGDPLKIRGDFKVAMRNAARFLFAVSAACAVVGGAVVGGLSAGGLSAEAAAAAFLFALPVCLLYVPEYVVDPYPTIDGVLQRNPMAAWYLLLAPVALELCHLVAAVIKAASWDDGTFVAVAAGAGVVWAVDAATTVNLCRSIAREIEKRSSIRSTSSEIAAAFLMVYLRYGLYLQVFHTIGSAGQLRWFN